MIIHIQIALTFSKLGSRQQYLNASLKPSVSAQSPPASCSNGLSHSEKKIIVYTRRAKLVGHENGDDIRRAPARKNGSAVFVRRKQLNQNGTRLFSNGVSKASLSDLIKGFVPSSAKRKRSKRGNLNRSVRPSDVISKEDSRDESSQRVTPSESYQLIRSPSITQVIYFSDFYLFIMNYDITLSRRLLVRDLT